MYCKNCGAKIEENAGFCGNCGTKIEIREPELEAAAQTSAEQMELKEAKESNGGGKGKKKKGLIIGIAAVVLCLIIGGGAFAYINYLSPAAQFDKYMELGEKYLLEKDYEQGIIAFEKAIGFDPKSVDARLSISDAYAGIDDYKSAAKYLEEAIDIDETCLEAYINVGKVYIVLENYDKAEKRLNQALDIDDQNMDIYDAMIEMYEKTQDEEKLKDTLDKCVQATGDSEKREQLETLSREFIIENMFQKKDNVPDVFIFDVTLPMISDKSPNADKINDQIRSDYKKVINAERSSYESLVSGFLYPTLEVKYEVHEFDGIYEIAIIERTYSTYGSGAIGHVFRYYYDTNTWNALTEDEFLDKIGITKASIMDSFNNEFADMEELLGFAYSDIKNLYILKSNKKPTFYMNLFI